MAQNENIDGQKSDEQKNDTANNVDENINNVPMFRQKKIFIPTLIILIAAILGIYWYIGQLAYVSTDDALIDGNRLSVSSKILGRIMLLTVDEGDTVKQGQLLVQLDSTDLKAQEIQARANINFARESITLSNVNLAKAQEDFNRAEQQYKENVIPKEQFDHIQKALEAAKAQLNIDKSKIQTAKAQLNVIETELLNTSIYSSLDGVLGKRWVLKATSIFGTSCRWHPAANRPNLPFVKFAVRVVSRRVQPWCPPFWRSPRILFYGPHFRRLRHRLFHFFRL